MLLKEITDAERKIRYKTELKCIKEQLESGKYEEGFRKYLEGKAKIIEEILSEY